MPNFEVSGRRTHEAVPINRRSTLKTTVLIEGAPHGLNATHASRFNAALMEFLSK